MEALNCFYFDGESSMDYGIKIDSPAAISGAERSITLQEVPGRNGALILDDGYYNNLDVSYDTWIKCPGIDDRAAWARRLKGWLLSKPGEYRVLYDSYDGNYCRFACYSGGLDISVSTRLVVQQTITFTAKPMSYLRSGLRLREISRGEIFVNPHRFEALPYIKITGNGDVDLHVGDKG